MVKILPLFLLGFGLASALATGRLEQTMNDKREIAGDEEVHV